MVDLMANIKNEKNMTMGNMKTLMATSVLCVFFNGALIYGMNEGKKSHSSYQTCRSHISGIHSENEKKIKETVDPEILIKKLNDNENKSYKIIPKYTMEKLGMKKKTKGNILKNVQNIRNIRKNILRNYKGHLSLCPCCNLFNNKKENVLKIFAEQENPELMLNIKNMSGYNKYIPLMPVGCDKDINGPDNGSNGKMFEMKEIINGELKDSKKEE